MFGTIDKTLEDIILIPSETIHSVFLSYRFNRVTIRIIRGSNYDIGVFNLFQLFNNDFKDTFLSLKRQQNFIWQSGRTDSCLNNKCQHNIVLMIKIFLRQTLLVPLEEFLDAVLDFHFVCPAEGVEFGYVDKLAHGAVGLGGVELHSSGEAHGLDDEF